MFYGREVGRVRVVLWYGGGRAVRLFYGTEVGRVRESCKGVLW